MSCWQAVRARHLKSEFSESTYIGLTVASLCQGFLTGIPVVVVVREMPRAYYVVLSLTIFLLSMAVLGLIFIPKMLMQQKYKGKSRAEQAYMIRRGVFKNSGGGKSGGSSAHDRYPPPMSASDVPMSSSICGYRSEARNCPSSEESDDQDSSSFAFRSDYARGNDLTTMSIPEERVLGGVEEEEEEEEDENEEDEEERNVYGNEQKDEYPVTFERDQETGMTILEATSQNTETDLQDQKLDQDLFTSTTLTTEELLIDNDAASNKSSLED